MRSSLSRRSFLRLAAAGALFGTLAAAQPVHAAKPLYNLTGHRNGTFHTLNGFDGELSLDFLGSTSSKKFTATGTVTINQAASVSGKGTINPKNAVKLTLKGVGLTAVLKGTVNPETGVFQGNFTGKDSRGQKIKGTFTMSLLQNG